jgi:hypothetical protein
VSNILKFRAYQHLQREPSLDSDGTPECDGAEYVRTYDAEGVICLPGEYEFYMGKFGRVLRVEPSNSGKRFVLTIDDGKWGWDQKGDYLCTLRGSTFEEALEDASLRMPNEAAFFRAGACKYHSNDPEFDEWFAALGNGTENLND